MDLRDVSRDFYLRLTGKDEYVLRTGLADAMQGK